ncbi:MAG: hypothetical protein ABI406_18685 [Ktedonobacteraceae bacterium]
MTENITPRLKNALAYWHDTYGVEEVQHERYYWNTFLVQPVLNILLKTGYLKAITAPGKHDKRLQITDAGLAVLGIAENTKES